ncbi:MAG: CAP domain-containing protein [Chloroflexota bacterium]
MVTTSGTDQAAAALNRINQYRAQVGVASATMHSSLKASAASHVAYYLQNVPISGSIHDQIEGKPGFTGKSFFDRAARFGYPNSQSTNEDIDTIADPVSAVDRLMATLNHRIPLLDPAYPDIGIASGATPDGKNPITVIDFGMPIWKESFQPAFFIWPPENGTNFFRSYRGESPDLFRKAGLNPAYPIGTPLSITYRGPGTIRYDANAMSLTDATGKAVAFHKVADLNSFFTARNSAVIASVQPLAPDTIYTVTFTYSINNGATQVRKWSFSTGATMGGGTLPEPKPGLANADSSVRTLWQGADGPVASGAVRRTWLYGPDIFEARYEPYDEAPGGKRVVYYLDKARLEITNPNGNRASQWFITSGLLVRELISGNLQLGDNHFEPRGPAQVPVAGDPGPVNPAAPTYATFSGLSSLSNDRRVLDRTGQPVLELLAKDGKVSTLPTAPAKVTCTSYEKTLGHNLPDVLMRWMNTLPGGWLYVLGLPLSEPYWMRVKVGGVEKDVLAQVFERRALTFTPSNTPEWQVEMGNIGRHYFTWRYGL